MGVGIIREIHSFDTTESKSGRLCVERSTRTEHKCCASASVGVCRREMGNQNSYDTWKAAERPLWCNCNNIVNGDCVPFEFTRWWCALHASFQGTAILIVKMAIRLNWLLCDFWQAYLVVSHTDIYLYANKAKIDVGIKLHLNSQCLPDISTDCVR